MGNFTSDSTKTRKDTRFAKIPLTDAPKCSKTAKEYSATLEMEDNVSTQADPRGLKRICMSCGTRFYDLNKDPIVCPSCNAEFTGEAKVKSRRGRAAVANDEKKESQVSPDTASDDDDDEDIGDDDDAPILDDDDDDDVVSLNDLDDDDDDLDDDIDLGDDLDDLDDDDDDDSFEDDEEEDDD